MKTNRITNAIFFAFIFSGLFAQTVCAQARAQAASMVSFSTLPTSFAIPSGWRLLSQEGEFAVIAPNTNKPEVLVVLHTGVYNNLDTFYGLAAKTIENELKIQQAQILQKPNSYQINGLTASAAVLSAYNPQGEAVKLGLNVVISANGMGMGALTLSSPAVFTQGQAAAEAVLQSARFGTIKHDNKAASGVVGRWYKAAAANAGNRNGSSGGWSSGSNVYYTFYENGTYSYYYESFASVDVPGMGGLSTSKDEDSGRYFIANGQITLVSNKNGSKSLVYRVVDDKYIQIGNGYFARR